ncbi:MAG: hypothetical protein KTR30_14605 [Saprospiraceae bacterium]|nr:hypothetical protein [Saprospiraceae bacterium]
MIRLFPLLFISILALSIFQCQSNTSISTDLEEKNFFDLRAFFEAEIVRLQEENPKIKKEIEINGKKEQKTQEGVDFEKELAIFIRSDINKPAWVDKYGVDSIMSSDDLIRVDYIALDSTLKTRLLSVEFEDAMVNKVTITNKTASPLIQSKQQLTFEPNKGYQIANQQDLSLSDDSQLRIIATFER